MTGTEILRLANKQYGVEVDVNENDIVKVGDDANVEVDAYLKKQFRTVTKYF
jgi:HlyD family secretion protein